MAGAYEPTEFVFLSASFNLDQSKIVCDEIYRRSYANPLEYKSKCSLKISPLNGRNP